MKLKNLTDCWIYSLETIKVDGEAQKKWKYKFHKRLNIQQDINQLDTNEAGIIDYDILKIRTDYDFDIEKSDGISLIELELDNENYAIDTPNYTVVKNPKVGKNTTYICERYHGE